MLNSPFLIPMPQSGSVQSVQFFPLLVPAVLGGSAAIAGWIGYKVGKPEYDQKGNRIPGLVESTAREVGKGVGNAITLAAVIGIGYLIFIREKKSR